MSKNIIFMKKKLITITLLIVITIIGGFLRFYKNTENPPSLNGDEISMGYDAYSILETGRDQYGKFMPITFKSVGDYKNPVPIYLMIPAIKLFGLNDFSVRFQNTLFATLMIPLFFLFLIKIFKDKSIALVGTLFLSISSWHILYSRIEYETSAYIFVLIGIWSFMKMLDGGRKWALLSAFFFILTMYTAPAPRLFVPIFVIIALIFNFRKFKNNWNKLIIFLITSVILVLPLVYATLYQGAGARLKMVIISNDIEFQRYILLKPLQSISEAPLLIFFWLKRYLNYLQPEFLFINGLDVTLPGTIGLGMLYLFELPWLVIGIAEFIRRKIPYKTIFIIWLLTGIIPDSITNNQQHLGRLLHIAPVIIMLVTLGAVRFFRWLQNLSNLYTKFTICLIYAVFIIICLTHAFLVLAVHFPRAKGESFDEGLKQVALYVLNHQDNYKEIIIDPRRGIEGPYLVSNPYLYILFYTKYDPHIYQTEPKVSSKDATYFFKFNKYTFRSIDWRTDTDKKGTLFIGSPWSFPKDGLKTGELLEKINMTNGYTAFYIVAPKN